MSKGSILIYTSAAGQAAPLPGVTLTVTDAGGSVRARLVTDADGFAEAADLPAPDAAYSLDAANTTVQPYALYRIEAALDGWQPLVLNGVQVFDAQQTVARLNLLPAGAAPASAVSRTGEVETDIVTIPPHTLFAGNGGSGPAPEELLPGSVWNTMPAHVHSRRMEAYFYFEVPEEHAVCHLMGEVEETRHIWMKGDQAVLSPEWSIHSAAATHNYTFIWGMGGENLDYGDQDFSKITDLK